MDRDSVRKDRVGGIECKGEKERQTFKTFNLCLTGPIYMYIYPQPVWNLAKLICKCKTITANFYNINVKLC